MRVAAEENALIARARRGDREAFDRLVRMHFEAVYSTLFRLVGNHEDAEDLAQQSFVRAWGSLCWYRGDGPFGAWLGRIALHLARDHNRRRGRGPVLVPLPAAGGESGGESGGEPAADEHRQPARELSGRELAQWLDGALRRLPEALREALVLRTLEGREYDEVARLTGVRPGTARLHVMKARRLLARWLGRWQGEER